jgi:hypothetical protein
MRKIIALLGLLSLAAFAADEPKPVPEPPPLPDASATPAASAEVKPEVTVKQRGEDKIEEYRIRGRLYMIKVTPRVGKPYYLVDHKGDGVFSHANERELSVPMWTILSW